MAGSAKDEAAGKGHNSHNDPAFVMDKVKELDKALRPHEKAIKEANEEIKGLKREFKTDTGITQAIFNSARKVALMGNEEEQKDRLEKYQLVYNSLNNGEQMNMFKVLDDKKDA